MKRKLLKINLLFLLLCISLGSATEKVGTTSMQFLKLSLDARSAAMGEAAVSIVNTSEAMYWNPAGLRGSSGIDFSTSYINYFLDVNIFSGAVSMPVGQSAAVGLFAIVVDYGTIDVTDVSHLGFNAEINNNGDWTYNPGLTGLTMRPSSSVFGGSFAFSVTNRLTFGISAKYMTENLYIAKASTFSFDGGLIFESGWRTLKFAVSIKNFGPDVKFINTAYPIPQTFDVGISQFIFSPSNALLGQLGSQSLLLAFDMTNARDYGEQYHAGVEYSFNDLLFLRGGYKMNYDEEGLTFGGGIKFMNLRIDYAYDQFGKLLPSVHRFSVGYTLN